MLLWVGGIFIAYKILLSDAVSNGVLGFFFGGQVPGTDIILPPEVMLWGVFGLFVGVAIVIIVDLWRASNRRLREFGLGESDSQHVTEEPLVAVGMTTVAEPRHQHARVSKLGDATKLLRTKAKTLFGPQAERATRSAHAFAHKAIIYTIGAYELSRIQCIKWAKKAHLQLVKSWRWVKPYLWKLDTWLELKWLQVSARVVVFARRQGFIAPAQTVIEPVIEEPTTPTPVVKKPRAKRSKTTKPDTKKRTKTTNKKPAST